MKQVVIFNRRGLNILILSEEEDLLEAEAWLWAKDCRDLYYFVEGRTLPYMIPAASMTEVIAKIKEISA